MPEAVNCPFGIAAPRPVLGLLLKIAVSTFMIPLFGIAKIAISGPQTVGITDHLQE